LLTTPQPATTCQSPPPQTPAPATAASTGYKCHVVPVMYMCFGGNGSSMLTLVSFVASCMWHKLS
jgi:hypothetical protein